MVEIGNAELVRTLLIRQVGVIWTVKELNDINLREGYGIPEKTIGSTISNMKLEPNPTIEGLGKCAVSRGFSKYHHGTNLMKVKGDLPYYIWTGKKLPERENPSPNMIGAAQAIYEYMVHKYPYTPVLREGLELYARLSVKSIKNYDPTQHTIGNQFMTLVTAGVLRQLTKQEIDAIIKNKIIAPWRNQQAILQLLNIQYKPSKPVQMQLWPDNDPSVTENIVQRILVHTTKLLRVKLISDEYAEALFDLIDDWYQKKNKVGEHANKMFSLNNRVSELEKSNKEFEELFNRWEERVGSFDMVNA